MSILSNGHLWKLTEFLENQKFSFDKNQILDSLSKEDIDQVSKIEKENFNSPWTRDQFIRCHNQSLIFSNYVYCKSSKIIGYLVAENIIDEVHMLSLIHI